MKTIEIDDRDDRLARCIASAREETVHCTRGGKPAALIANVEGCDAADLSEAADAAFWRMIQERRRQPTLSREELERADAA